MKKHDTAFYLEALLLIVVFIGMILVLTRIFGLGKAESAQAKHLTGAVTLATSAAEAASAAESPDDLLLLVNENDNATLREQEVTARYSAGLVADPEGPYEVVIRWEPTDSDPQLVDTVITVFYGDAETPIYVLETAVYLGQEVCA